MDTEHVAPRVSVLLKDDERAALREICNQEVRPPQWTMRWLIMQEAQRRGISPHIVGNENRAGAVVEAVPSAAVS